jgi:hypothetical protein
LGEFGEKPNHTNLFISQNFEGNGYKAKELFF